MADSVLCIDVLKSKVVALLVDVSSKVAVVHKCVAVDIRDQPFEDVVARLVQLTNYSDEACHLSFSPEYFSFRTLSLPFADRKKIEQVLPFELVECSAVEVDSLLFDFVVTNSGPEGAQVLVAMIAREILAEKLSAFMMAGINPDSIGISGVATCLNVVDSLGGDFVLLDFEDPVMSLYLVANGRIVLVRSLLIEENDQPLVRAEGVGRDVLRTLLASQGSLSSSMPLSVFLTGGTSLQGELKDALLRLFEGGVDVALYSQSEQPLIKVDLEIRNQYAPDVMDRVLARALKKKDLGRDFNFRKEEFKKKKSVKEYRRLILTVAIPLVLACILLVGYQVVQYQKLLGRQDGLRNKIVSVFKETVPGVTRVVNPVQQLQVVNNEIKAVYRAGSSGSGGAHTMIEILTEVSARIPASYKVKVVRFVANFDLVRFKGQTEDFNTVDNIQRVLEESDYFTAVDISSANQSSLGDEVRFELKMKLAR